MKTTSLFALLLALAGCGAETAGTAALTGAGQAEQLQQAQQLKQDVQNQLDQAVLAEQQKLKETEAAAQGR